MLRNTLDTTTYNRLRIVSVKADEDVVVAQFAARVNALASLSQASMSLRARLLDEVKYVARHINGSAEAAVSQGYGRRVLYEAPGRWSLAAIIFRPGQQTELHDHGGWGCAATVQGIERDRRFVHDAWGNLVLSTERDYHAGTGYVFDPVDVHQPIGAYSEGLTIALHFLVHNSGHHNAQPESLHTASRRTKIAA